MKFLSGALLLLLPFLTLGQDVRIQKMIDELEWKSEQTSSGNTQIVFNVDGNEARTQAIFIGKTINELGDFEIIEVWSYSAVIPNKKFNEEIAVDLLTGNESTKLGAWSLFKLDDKAGYKVVYTAKLFLSDLTSAQLKTICTALTATCDQKERDFERLTGEKDKW